MLNRISIFYITFGLLNEFYCDETRFCQVNWNHSAIVSKGELTDPGNTLAYESSYNISHYLWQESEIWKVMFTENDAKLTKSLGMILDQRWESITYINEVPVKDRNLTNHYWSYKKDKESIWQHVFSNDTSLYSEGYFAKIHRYKFLLTRLNNTSETLEADKILKNDDYDWLWFYMYVAMCDDCQLIIEIWNKNMENFTFIERGSKKWKPIQIWAVGNGSFKINLITYSTNAEDMFWAISDKVYTSPCRNLTRVLESKTDCEDINNKGIASQETYQNCAPEKPPYMKKKVQEAHIFPTLLIISIIVICFVTISLGILAWFIYKMYKSKQYNAVNNDLPLSEKTLINILQKSTSGVKINEFEKYVKTIFQSNDKTLELQFKTLPSGYVRSCQEGLSATNRDKNKNHDVVPYDDNRVKLSHLPYIMAIKDVNDYINASFIKGVDTAKEYIICQNPLPSRIEDFWEMIWQNDIAFIIYLQEKMKKEVEYWPNVNKTLYIGDIEIICESYETFEYFNVRSFKVSRYGIAKQIKQYHYIYWPNLKTDHIFSHMLIEFLQTLQMIPHGNPPILLHCEDGIGSVGLIALCDMAIRLSSRIDKFDLRGISEELLYCRADVINFELYLFSYLLIFEYQITDKHEKDLRKLKIDDDTSNNILHTIESNVVWNSFKRVKWLDKVQSNHFIQIKNFGKKNRYDNYPMLHSRVKLEDMIIDYINATYVDGYRMPNKFIVTQYPLHETRNDFWIMILQQQVTMIVNLNEVNLQQPKYPELWASETKILPDITVEYIKRKDHLDYDEIFLELYKMGKLLRKISIINMKYWYKEMRMPDTSDAIISVWEAMIKYIKTTNSKSPVVVISDDGISGTDIFVCLDYIIEKMKNENTIGTLSAIRAIRRSHKFSFDEEKIQFLQKCILSYLKKEEML